MAFEDQEPDFSIKQRDTWPPVDAILSDADGPINLTGATVKLILKTVAGSVAVNSACTITNAAGGGVRYQWVPADTAVVATYQGEFEITFGDGRIATVPNVGYLKFVVSSDLA